MSIRSFTRFMTNCPQDDFHLGLVPVAVLLVPFLAVVSVLVVCTAAFGIAAILVSEFMDLIADTAKWALGVRVGRGIIRLTGYGRPGSRV